MQGIKFRVYSKKEKIFYYFSTDHIGTDDINTLYKLELEGSIDHQLCLFYKDQEIYEGDIYLNDWDRPEVVTLEIKKGLTSAGQGINCNELSMGFKLTFNKKIKIIGNKDENPELLKKR